MIYAERQDAGGNVLEKGMFLSYAEVVEYDRQARERGEKWTGALRTNIALNRARHDRCWWCGAAVGTNHAENCTPGTVSTEPVPTT